MKAHLMIALALLMGAVFTVRTLDAVATRDLGLNLVYLAGGFGFAVILLLMGWREKRKPKD